jgi:hypothetical protein
MNQNYQSQVRVKQEIKVTDKKFAFTATVTWSRVLHDLETKNAHFRCALFAGKNHQIGYGPGKVNTTLHN